MFYFLKISLKKTFLRTSMLLTTLSSRSLFCLTSFVHDKQVLLFHTLSLWKFPYKTNYFISIDLFLLFIFLRCFQQNTLLRVKDHWFLKWHPELFLLNCIPFLAVLLLWLPSHNLCTLSKIVYDSRSTSSVITVNWDTNRRWPQKCFLAGVAQDEALYIWLPNTLGLYFFTVHFSLLKW